MTNGVHARAGRSSLLIGLLLLLAAFNPQWEARAQDTPAAEEAARAEVMDRVHRARRLRNFGYPLLARTQLEAAMKLDPKSREILVETVRLYLTPGSDLEEVQPAVAAILELYPDDYEACFELARLQYRSEVPPQPPNSAEPEELKVATARLAAEMKVFRELAAFLAKPGHELPAASRGRPALSLAWLARCASQAPGSPEVLHLAGQELFYRARTFHQWANAEPALAEFGKAANELFALAEPLFRACLGSPGVGQDAAVFLVESLVHMARHKDAKAEAAAAELVNPGNLRIAGALGDIAEATGDLETLIAALEKMHAVYGEAATEADLRAAKRIRDNKWNFARWTQYRDVEGLPAHQRRQAWTALAADEPGFLEVYYLSAVNCVFLARTADQPEDKRRWLDESLALLEKCQDLGADFADWHTRKGTTLWMLGRYEEAAACYDAAGKLAPHDAEAFNHAAAARDIAAGKYTSLDYDEYLSLLEPGDYAHKRTQLLAMVKRAPKFTAAQVSLGEVCHLLGDFEGARAATRAALELAPDNATLVENAAEAAFESAQYAEAAKLFEKLAALEPARAEPRRKLSLGRDLAKGSVERRRAFALWRQTQRPVETDAARRHKLEEAMRLDATLPEVLIDLAALERSISPERSAILLEDALRHSRDEFTKAAAHRERGRLLGGLRKFAQAVAEYEAAWAAFKSDGADLLLAALTLTEAGDHSAASAAMRRLFAEVPLSPLLRPRDRDVAELGLLPVKADSPRRIAPAYSAGDKAEFTVQLVSRGEGGGQKNSDLKLEYGLAMEVVETPGNGGLWVLKVQGKDPPGPEFNALALMSFELRISPWFGLVEAPPALVLGEVVHPALQALAEAFTAGLGEGALSPPLVWKNVLTKGPPHFGGQDSAEVGALTRAMGAQILVERKAFAGRRVGDERDPFRTENISARTLHAQTLLSGPRRLINETGFEINMQELTKARDDVVISHLSVKLSLK